MQRASGSSISLSTLILSTGIAFSIDLAPRSAWATPVVLDGCSGTLVQLQDLKWKNSGLVVTAGHCSEAKLLKPDSVLRNRTYKRSGLKFDDAGIYIPLTSDIRILYASMKGQDLAIFELPISLEELQRHGIEPAKLANEEHGFRHFEIQSGFWRDQKKCERIGKSVSLQESAYYFPNTIALGFGCNGVRAGHSGSGALSVTKDLSQVLSAIVFTTHANQGGKSCDLNHPCEIQNGKKATFPDRTYASPVSNK